MCREELPEILLPYQKKWVSDNSHLKICEKSRRTGISYAEALFCCLKAMGKEGSNCYYLSYNKDMTRQFIQDCAFWARLLNVATAKVDEYVLKDENEDVTVFRIKFDSGYIIEALPSKAHVLRSKQGHVVLDEAAFTDEFEKVVEAALAMLIWGGSFSIISTHNGDDNPFNKLIEEIREGKAVGWSLHRITFNEALEQGLYRMICRNTKKEWTQSGEDAFVKSIRDIYKEKAEQELDVKPLRAGMRYFSRALLNTCAASDIPVMRLTCSDNFTWEKIESREMKVREWLTAEVLPYLKSLHGSLYFGWDFARSGDLSVVWVCEEISKTKLVTRFVLELKNVPFDQQEQTASFLYNYTKRFGWMAIDARGNGQSLAEKCAQRFGLCDMVMIDRSFYASTMPKVKCMFEDGNIIVPDDDVLLSDFSTVHIKNGIPLITEKNDDRDKGKRHGDGACSLALCCYGWSEASSDCAPYVAGKKAKNFSLFF